MGYDSRNVFRVAHQSGHVRHEHQPFRIQRNGGHGGGHVGVAVVNFSVLAILISCLGLLGLASYSTLQRTKEIGIRKVLGASVTTIVRLLSGEFLRLVVLALLVAIPLCWFFMHRWLADYQYRIDISWWIFIVSGAAAVVIAVLSVSFQAIRAALSNPAKTLKTE